MSDHQSNGSPVLLSSPPPTIPLPAPFKVIAPIQDLGEDQTGQPVLVPILPQVIAANGEVLATAEGNTLAQSVANAHRIAQALNSATEALGFLDQIKEVLAHDGITLPQEVAFLIEGAITALQPQTIVADDTDGEQS